MANQPTKYSKFLIGAASAALVASAVAPVASAADFKDTKGNTHETAIDALSDAGVITGYPDGTFLPNKTLTRSDVVKMLGKWLVKSQGFEVPTDYKTKPRFADQTSKTNDELLKYSAVVKDNGVFNGLENGSLNATADITRENMALVLVRAFDSVHKTDLVAYVAEKEFNKDVTDRATAKAEARPYIDVLDFFDITNPVAPKFNPKATTTRGQFASFLYKTTNVEISDINAEVDSIKAINNTTVEVTFKTAIEDIKALDFAIEGLTVSNASVKQTGGNKVAVLTTSAQVGDKAYTVTANGKKLGSFKGVSAVIPTSIKVTTPSVQGTIGKEATMSAQVTVPEGQSKAGIPVTFNITSDNTTGALQNGKVEAIAYTNADGVASYSYTRYYAHNDSVVAYATSKSDVAAYGTVYWAESLSVTDVTEGTSFSNNSKKVYKVKGSANTWHNVTFEENIGVTADKINDAKVLDAAYGSGTTPYQLANGSVKSVAVLTDAKGEATFSVTGADVSVTPIVFKNSDPTLYASASFQATELNAKAAKITFSDVTYFDLKVEAVKAQYATAYNNYNGNGGRDYKVTVTGKDGKTAAKGEKVYVFLDGAVSKDAYLLDKNGVVILPGTGKDGRVIELEVGNNGEAKFTVFGLNSLSYATPVVFLDRGTVSADDKKLSSLDLTKTGEITYFKAAVATSVAVKYYDATGKEVTSAKGSAKAKLFVLDQNDKVKVDESTSIYSARFEVENTSSKELTVVNGSVSTTVKQDRIAFTSPVVNGVAQIDLSTAEALTANIYASYNGLTTNSSISFNSTLEITNPYSGALDNINTTNETIKFTGFNPVKYAGETGVTYKYYDNTGGGASLPALLVDQTDFEKLLTGSSAANVTYSKVGDVVSLYVNTRTPGTGLGTVTGSAQASVNDAIATAIATGSPVVNLNLNTPGDIVVNVPAPNSLTVNIAGTIGGTLTVNAPNSHVNNSATVTGTTTITDVSNSSFVNNGTLAAVNITDANGTRFVNNKTVGVVTVNTAGLVTLGGNIATVNVTKAATVTVEAGAKIATLNASAAVKLSAPAGTVTAITTTGDGAVTAPTGETLPVTPETTNVTGTLELSAATVFADETVLVTVKDADLNIDATTADTVTVKVNGTDLVLKETEVNNGIFTGTTAKLTAGSVDVIYTDAFSATATNVAVTKTITVKAALSTVATIEVEAGSDAVVTAVGTEVATVANATTVDALLEAIKSTDGSTQAYAVKNASNVEKTTGTLVTGDKLVVTAEDGVTKVTYVITVTA